MNTRHLLAGVAALTITISGIASAEGIYKWTDEDGNVHYEDRPSGAPTEERLTISYNRTSREAVQKRVAAQRSAVDARREAKEDAEKDKQTAAEARAEAEQKMAKCQEYRGKMKTMLESRRLYRENEAGERVYLDDAAREEARKKAQELIQENCNS